VVKNDENSDMEKHTASYEYRSTFTVLQTTRDLCAFTDNFLTFNHLMGALKPHSNGPLYSNTVIGTLPLMGAWAVTFGTVRRRQGGLWLRPVPSSLYQM